MNNNPADPPVRGMEGSEAAATKQRAVSEDCRFRSDVEAREALLAPQRVDTGLVCEGLVPAPYGCGTLH